MTQQEPRRVLVAMSGGVDSSVAAKLLRERGDVCVGCTMKLYHNEDIGLSRGDIRDAIGHEVVPARKVGSKYAKRLRPHRVRRQFGPLAFVLLDRHAGKASARLRWQSSSWTD